MCSRQLLNESSKNTPRSSTSTSGVTSEVTVGSSLPDAGFNCSPPALRAGGPPACEGSTPTRPAVSSRCVGQLAPDAQQLSGGTADRELRLLGREEVPVHRVVGVDSDTAVHVHRRVGDTMPRLGCPECGGADVDIGGKVLRQPPRRL